MGLGRQLTDEDQATVIAYLLTGMDVTEIVDKTGFSWSTVNRLRHTIPEHLIGKARQERKEIEDARQKLEDDLNSLPSLIISHMKRSIAGAGAIAAMVEEDDEWRTKQSAEGLEKLYTGFTRQSLHIYEAAERAKQAEWDRQEAERIRQLPPADVKDIIESETAQSVGSR